MSTQSSIARPMTSAYAWLKAAFEAFMGNAPDWYKLTIIGFLVANPIVMLAHGSFVLGWLLLLEFIFTLALALRCYPLLPGGLLALEALLLGMTTPEVFYEEVVHGLPVILLVTFMVAAVHFLRDFLFLVLTRIMLGIRSRVTRAFVICAAIAVLSAFLDALTVLAVLLTVGLGFFDVYHRVVSEKSHGGDGDEHDREELEEFRAFLRGMMMHAAVGTAIGGVCTLVGEPENIVIGSVAGWSFMEFFWQVAPISIPTLVTGLATCLVVERFRLFGFGANLPAGVRHILEDHDRKQHMNRTPRDRIRVAAQGLACVLLVVALGLHIAEVGLIGVGLLVFGASINGVTDEHRIAKSFEAGMPFVALLVVFFAIVGVIHTQQLFAPVIDSVLRMDGKMQLVMIYLSNGLLSAVSDNVFVATIYIDQVHQLFEAGLIPLPLYEKQAAAIVMGTGIPAMATPNGQAAFLFLLTSALATHIRLSYGRMVWMALPYVITTSTAALLSIVYFF
ncbi:MAG TPA: sodium/proton antiporter NhaB [Gammaproteobacteria bacterium]